MKRTYLVLAIVGAILPYLFFVPFFQAEGFGPATFMKAVFVNGAAGGLSADLLFSSFVFWLFMFMQQKRGKGPGPWPYVALNLLIGLSCALPAYLYSRERP